MFHVLELGVSNVYLLLSDATDVTSINATYYCCYMYGCHLLLMINVWITNGAGVACMGNTCY